MRRTTYIFAFFLSTIVLFSSCNKEGSAVSRLVEIDSLLYCNLDSASQMLAQMKGEVPKLSAEARAYYDLLSVKYTDKSMGKHLSDSLIMSVVDYYEQSPEQQHLYEAYFYAGRVCSDVDSSSLRVLYYMELAQMADSTWINDFWRSRIMAQKGYVYSRCGLFSEAYDMQELARNYCETIGDTAGVRICTEELAAIEEMALLVPTDSVSLDAQRQAVKRINERARLKQAKLENARLKQDNESRRVSPVVGLVLALAGMAGLLMWRKRHARRKAEMAALHADAAQRRQEPSRRTFFDAEVDELLQSRAKADKALRGADWQLIEQRLLAVYPDFRSQLYSLYELSETEYHICMLIKMEVTPSSMARLLAMGKSSISQSRLRMQQRVFDGNGTAKDWDTFILGL